MTKVGPKGVKVPHPAPLRSHPLPLGEEMIRRNNRRANADPLLRMAARASLAGDSVAEESSKRRAID